MLLTEQHVLKKTPELDDLTFRSKNLYNFCLYTVRQNFFKTNNNIPYEELYHLVKKQDCYSALPRKVSQWVVKQVFTEFKSFIKASQSYNKDPSKFTGKPRLPHYKDKQNGRNLITYTSQAISKKLLKQNIVNPSGTDVKVKTQQSDIKQVRIIPHKHHITVEVIYERQEQNSNLNPDNAISIDLGVDNLTAITSNKPGLNPLLVNGRPVKSINQYYNKNKSRLQSLLPKDQYWSNKIDKLTNKRNRRIKHYLHCTSKFIIELCKKNDIGTIVIGKNDFWKQEVNLGVENNQNFVSIPFDTLVKQIEYKAQLCGISVIISEEAYTSKCSFLDNETIEKHDKYKGRRIKRGLYKSSVGRLINSDINGSYNIMRKASEANVIPNVVYNDKYGTEGSVVNPVFFNEEHKQVL